MFVAIDGSLVYIAQQTNKHTNRNIVSKLKQLNVVIELIEELEFQDDEVSDSVDHEKEDKDDKQAKGNLQQVVVFNIQILEKFSDIDNDNDKNDDFQKVQKYKCCGSCYVKASENIRNFILVTQRYFTFALLLVAFENNRNLSQAKKDVQAN